MQPRVSVVIPSYNTGRYIAEAVLSACGEMDDAEIIVVDDASTDDTLANLNKLGLKNLRIIQLKENSPGGAGYPSNLGLAEAHGDYIAFVDSDDFFIRGYLSEMLDQLVSTNTDMCVASYTLVDAITHTELAAYGANRWGRILAGHRTGLLCMDDYLQLSPEPWRKIYHKRIFANPDVRFPVNGWFNEDYPFHWFAGLSARNGISYVSNHQYYHRINRAGQTTSALDKRIYSVFDHTLAVREFMNKSEDYCKYTWCLIRWLVLGLWKVRLLRQNPEDYFEKIRSLILSFDERDLKLFMAKSRKDEKVIYLALRDNTSPARFCTSLAWEWDHDNA